MSIPLLALHSIFTPIKTAHSLKSILPHFLSNGHQNDTDHKHHESKRQHDRAQGVSICLGYSSKVKACEDQSTDKHAAPGADQHDGVAVEFKCTTRCSSMP